MKKVCVSIVGSGQLHEITIQPGTTAGDILRDLNLPDYLLSRSPSADFFAATESIYEKIADGQKIFASTKATVGRTLFDLLRKSADNYFSGRQSRITSGPAQTLPRVTHSNPIRRQLLPYWQEAGWSRVGGIYRGNYQTRYGAYQGGIEEKSPHNINFYILDPPRQVLESSHSPCFQPRDGNWFHVHMSARPKDVSSGIVTIEQLITACLENRS
jgi:hypothetical protein